MNHALSALLITLALFLGMLVLLETGRRIGNRRLRDDAEGARADAGTIEGAALRDLFRRYVDSRLETYRKLPDMEAVKMEFARSIALQGEMPMPSIRRWWICGQV